MNVYMEVKMVCTQCGMARKHFSLNPRATLKTHVNETTDELVEGGIYLHPCVQGPAFGTSDWKRTVRSVAVPVGTVAIGFEETA